MSREIIIREINICLFPLLSPSENEIKYSICQGSTISIYFFRKNEFGDNVKYEILHTDISYYFIRYCNFLIKKNIENFSINNFKIILSINENILENNLINKNVSFMSDLIECLKVSVPQVNVDVTSVIKTLINSVKYSKSDDFDYEQALFKKRLFVYQEENIKWMLNIEQELSKKKYQFDILNFCNLSENFVFYNRKYIFKKDKINNKLDIQFCGGGLFDDTGCGKTLSMLGLCTLNTKKYLDLKEKKVKCTNQTTGEVLCSVIMQNGNNKGGICGKKVVNLDSDDKRERNLCSLHIKREKNKMSTFIPLISSIPNFQKNFYTKNNSFIKSSATLIISPNHLCQQWESEIIESLSDNKKIVILTTKNDKAKVSNYDLICADFVICSFNYLINPVNIFSVFGSKNLNSFYPDNIFKTISLFNISKINSIKSKEDNFLKEEGSTLSLFKWFRIIIDEFHELEDNITFLSHFIKNFSSKFKWILSGTPFAHGAKSFINSIDFLIKKKNDDISNNIDVFTFIQNKLIRRNTKDSVKNEFILPDIIEDNIWLDFSQVERAMYNNHISTKKIVDKIEEDVYLRQLCCHPNISAEYKEVLENCKTLDDVKNAMLKNNKFLLEQARIKLNMKEKEFTKISKFLDSLDDTQIQLRNDTISQKRTLGRLIQSLKNDIAGFESGIKYFEQILPKIEKSELEDDPITLEPIPHDNVGFTICGHIYNYDTLKELIISTGKCALCNKVLDPAKDIFKISVNANIENSDSDKIKKLINLHGTKMAHIISQIETIIQKTDDKCIIFSQWDNMLTQISEKLSKNNILHAVCRGNVMVKNAAIKKFNKEKDCRIILLSTDNCAAGLNLTKASKIFMIDPIYGDEDYRITIETQVLGRAYRLGQTKKVSITRFLIKNSVEEKLFKQSYTLELKTAMQKLFDKK